MVTFQRLEWSISDCLDLFLVLIALGACKGWNAEEMLKFEMIEKVRIGMEKEKSVSLFRPKLNAYKMLTDTQLVGNVVSGAWRKVK